MRAFVGVTDTSWYQFLAARPDISEVNFWRPGGRGFKAISTGQPFLFKSHAPHNRLVGGGFLSSSTQLRISEAWELFGEGNGVASHQQLRHAIAAYRRTSLSPSDDPVIGCVLIRDVFFVPLSDQLPPPPDFAGNIVVGKTYELTPGSALESSLATLLMSANQPLTVQGNVFGDPRLVPNRLGQQAFKALVLTSYHRRCAITGAKIAPTLEAAHIRPAARGGENRLDNGLLLRSDIHTLYDRGYLGVDTNLRLRVSPRLREDFSNGAEFYAREGTEVVNLPERRVDRPNREVLTWHMDTLFKSA